MPGLGTVGDVLVDSEDEAEWELCAGVLTLPLMTASDVWPSSKESPVV